jgi:hypothetical protein
MLVDSICAEEQPGEKGAEDGGDWRGGVATTGCPWARPTDTARRAADQDGDAASRNHHLFAARRHCRRSSRSTMATPIPPTKTEQGTPKARRV